MVSIAGLGEIPRQAAISRIAELLDAPESDVTLLLEEGRLGGALLALLRRRGIAATPNVKNSVQRLVRTLEDEDAARAPTQTAEVPIRSQGTSTIMFTDIVGSSAMMERLGDRAGRLVLRTHDEIMRRLTAEHDGSIVKSMGDGFMVVFRSVRSAVTCAIAVQRALAEHNSRAGHARISVRVGLTVGEPVQDNQDLFGLSVITAARIAAEAKGGQVLLSQIAYALASSSGDFEFRDVGSTRLKGIAGSHSLFEVAWDLEDGAGSQELESLVSGFLELRQEFRRVETP